MSTAELQQLRSKLAFPQSLITDNSLAETYSHDETDYRIRPSAVLIAEDRDDVVTAVRFCLTHNIPITARGAGTGLSGGCVPSKGALVLSTEKLDFMRLFPQDRVAICGPGVITKDLQDEAAKFNLTYPPDPASYAESTLGGNVAENAGGLRCKRFGVTKDYVIGLEAVTGKGELVTTGILSDTQGFSFGDVFIASEGTLAIVTSIAARLIPLPARGYTILAAFESPGDAARTVSEINASGMILTVMEFLDGDTVALVNEYAGTNEIQKAAGVLLMETSDRDVESQSREINLICRRNRASFLRTESDPETAESLWELRRNVSNAARDSSKVKVSEDIAVPNSKFPALVEFVAHMNQSSPLRINSYGHAGDGNLHVNFLSATGSAEDMQLIRTGINALLRQAIALGGTLTGEHGIGIAKKDFMSLEFDEPTLSAMRTFKSVFDPQNVLNPGKLFPESK